MFINFGGIANVGFLKKGEDIGFCNLFFNKYAKQIESKDFD